MVIEAFRLPAAGRTDRRQEGQTHTAPRIGITSNFDGERQVYLCRPAYVRAVEAAGGLPILLPYLGPSITAPDILDVLDGLLLSGGGDLDPSLYGEGMHPTVESVIPERDAFELSLAREALARDIPVLGICRGMQVLNVAAGGSLCPDIPSYLPHALHHWVPTRLTRAVHRVTVDPHTVLSRVTKAATIHVNSWHHQAIDGVANGFRASAHTPDGVIEAIEVPTRRFILGVQWHPEYLCDSEPACRRLFSAFVAACTRGGAR